jgi:oligopeptide transport system substrate-binding protein
MLGARKPAIAAALVSVMAVAACGSSGGGGGGGAGSGGGGNGKVDIPKLADTPTDSRVGKPGGDFRLHIAEPTAIDPYNSQESEGQLVTKNVFDTLVTADVKGNVTKLLAQSYSSNANCTDWTFIIKPDQKFSNGEAVDAESIKREMTRASLMTAASAVAYHMENVKGFDVLQASNATDPTKVDFSGVTATGNTLKIALTLPDCEFPLKTAQPVFSPVPAEAGAATNTKFNDDPIGNGPFMMAGPWQHDKNITLVRNPNYTDGPKALLDKVSMTINDSSDSSFEVKGFTNGDFDYARVFPNDLQSSANKYYSSDASKNQFIKENTFGIDYLIPQVKTKPLNSVDAREAVSYAIDRDAIINGIEKNSVTKATSIVPPPFQGQGTYQPGICASCVKQDPAKAKAAAKRAGLGAGTTVNLEFNTGAGHEGWIQAVAGELQQVLGWKVNIVPLPFKTLLKNENDPNATGLFRSAWGADYPTAWDFLGPLLSTQPADNPGQNSGRYSNKQFDQLLLKGQAETDAKKRADDYKAAEKLAIGDDLALIPLWYRTQYRVFSPKFVGVNLDFFENPTLATIGLK